MEFSLVFLVCLVTTTAAQTTPSAACGNTSYYGPSGFIRSPNYPGDYYKNLTCNYYIYASTGSSLLFVFESFRTENKYDQVSISCASDSNIPQQNFTGSALPNPVWISPCSRGLVNFITDAFVEETGFSISYNVIPKADETCGETGYYGPTGVISSYNFPDNYYDNLNCSYYIYAVTGNSITLSFKAFDVEEGYDYVTISCPTNSSVAPRRYSGHSLPDAISLPWCSQGLVNFITDNSTVSSGFSLNFYVSLGGCGNTAYSGSNGYVTSPNYPNEYGIYLNCSNIISAPERSTFNLTIEVFFLYNTCCTCDWLEISCLDNSGNGPYTLCGRYSDVANMYIYRCSQVLLWFHSDHAYGHKGFKIQYFVYPDSASTTAAVPTGYTQTTYTPPTSTPPTSTLEPACSVDYHYESYGVITSPNYPGNYYNNISCYHYIYGTRSGTIAFIFDDFHVQDYPDSVRIDCQSNSSVIEQRYSGHTIPPPLSIIWCNTASIYFYTDSSIVYSGFNIKYYVSDGDCGHTVHNGSSGQVISPNYPNNYNYHHNCSHIIWAPQRSHFHLNFLSFRVEDCGTCEGDWVEISCLDNNPSYKSRFCGSTAYPLDFYQCTQVLVWFHSDGDLNYKGFQLEYNVSSETENTSVAGRTELPKTASTSPIPALKEGCGLTFHCGPSGTITSPNYPGNYYDSFRCNYVIQGSQGNSIVLVFGHFDMQDDKDNVTIRCETNSSFPEQTYSGHTLPPPLTIPWCSRANVIFNSDNVTVYSGFKIDFYVSDAACGNTVFNGSVGTVKSPNYPISYGYYVNCSNIIWAPQRSHFYLKFQAQSSQGCGLCSCDWVEISCLDNNPSIKHRLCGSISYSIDLYQCTQVLVWFHSDGYPVSPYFALDYNVFPETDCGEVSYYGPSGVISSPNYPGSYNDALYCDYNIYTASSSGSIAIIFQAFNTEECCDYLTVSCPTNSSYSPVTYSGSSLPQPISIPWCSHGRVNFNSDRSVISTGFSLDYHVSVGGDLNMLDSEKPSASEREPSNGKPNASEMESSNGKPNI